MKVRISISSAVQSAGFILCLAAMSCSRPSAGGAPGGRPGSGPVPVLVATAVSRDVPVEIHAIGNVQAESVVMVRPQITAPIAKVWFREGQEVRAGDVLYTLDARPWEAAANQAAANLKRDEAQLFSARLDFERTSNLFAGKIASHDDFDKAEATYRALEASTFADNAAISNAQTSLSYATIRTPIDGRTGNIGVKEGNVVKATDDVLVSVARIRPVFVGFAVPEESLPVIRERSGRTNLSVRAMLPGKTNVLATGELTFVNNSVDTNTGTIFLKATFANTNEVLWPGQYVEVSLRLNMLEDAALVPSQSIQSGQDGSFVFVVKTDHTVEARPVATGQSMDGMTVIVTGIKPGEVVVTDGQLRLTPGAAVTIKSEDDEHSKTVVKAGADAETGVAR